MYIIVLRGEYLRTLAATCRSLDLIASLFFDLFNLQILLLIYFINATIDATNSEFGGD